MFIYRVVKHYFGTRDHEVTVGLCLRHDVEKLITENWKDGYTNVFNPETNSYDKIMHKDIEDWYLEKQIGAPDITYINIGTTHGIAEYSAIRMELYGVENITGEEYYRRLLDLESVLEKDSSRVATYKEIKSLLWNLVWELEANAHSSTEDS